MTESVEYISGFSVAYGDQDTPAPSNRVREIGGRSDDINAGFGGKFVWLVPTHNNSAGGAVTSFDVLIQDKADPTKDDLAKGAGGKFRYLVPIYDHQNQKKIFNIGLLRSKDASGVPQGYHGKSSDLNQGRGGDFLYVVWKTV